MVAPNREYDSENVFEQLRRAEKSALRIVKKEGGDSESQTRGLVRILAHEMPEDTRIRILDEEARSPYIGEEEAGIALQYLRGLWEDCMETYNGALEASADVPWGGESFKKYILLARGCANKAQRIYDNACDIGLHNPTYKDMLFGEDAVFQLGGISRELGIAWEFRNYPEIIKRDREYRRAVSKSEHSKAKDLERQIESFYSYE